MSPRYRVMQYVGRCDRCDRLNHKDRPLGPADVTTGRTGAKLCRRCWWRALRGEWEPLAAEWFTRLARETFPGSEEL